MVDWLWFSAGFACDSIVLAFIMVVLGPWVIERWIERNLTQLVKDFLTSEDAKEIRALLVKQFAGGLLGGRPVSVKGAIKEGIGQATRFGIHGVLQRIFSPQTIEGANEAAATAAEAGPK